MYILYIALLGLVCINEIAGYGRTPERGTSVGVRGFFGETTKEFRKMNWQIKGVLQMRAKRSKAIDDSYDNARVDIVTSLAAGGGGSGNCRAISPVYSPRTANQKTYVKYLGEPDTKIVLGIGAAGSGKTLFACYTAIQELRRGAITKIIITRPVVPVEEEEIGFLPGSLINKMDPWTRPIFDILLEFYAQKDIDAMLHGGVIEISPLAFMRGRTFKRAFIIADEMQNSSPNQMLMLTTRLGEGSKMVITGDLKQSDRGANNGLSDLLGKLKAYDSRHRWSNSSISNSTAIKYVELESEDVQRSAIVAKILDIYGGNNSGSEVAAVPPPPPPVCNISTVTGSSLFPTPTTNSTVDSGTKIVRDESKKKVIEVANDSFFYLLRNTENGSSPTQAPGTHSDAALIPIHHMSKRLRK